MSWRAACSRTSRPSSTARARRSGTSSRHCSAGATCCSRTCPGRRRRSSRGRSPAPSRTFSSPASSARPISSRPTRRASPSTTRSTARSCSGPARSSPTSSSSTRSTARRRRRSRRCSRPWPSTRSPSTVSRAQLPDPFLLIATENPIEYEGTFPLPEAQLDRFFLRTSLGYPGEQQELQIVREQRHGHPIDGLRPALTLADVAALQRAADDVYLDDLLEEWIVRLVRQTRDMPGVDVGASVRGSLALARTSRAWALLHERDHVPAAGRPAAVPAGARPQARPEPDVRRRQPAPLERTGARAAARPVLRTRAAAAAGLDDFAGAHVACTSLARRDVPARSTLPADGDPFRNRPEHAPGPRHRPGGLAALRAGRSDLDDRLGRQRPALDGARRGPVRRPPALRGRGAARRRRGRPPSLDDALSGRDALARRSRTRCWPRRARSC